MTARNRQYFDQGYAAFARTFPHVAATVPFRPFYVCPSCLVAYNEKALDDRMLTREDVPPKSVGGRKIVLTCKTCNDRAGHEIDWHAHNESELMGFLTREKADMRAHLRTATGHVPIDFKVNPDGMQMIMVPNATRQSESDAVTTDFSRAALPDGWQDFTFNIEFPSFSPPRAATSWLRAAYLALFAALGYRFIFRRELDVVRARIANPELPDPATFRVIQHQATPEPMLIRIEEPDAFRSYVMFYGRNVVFLPRYGDRDLYARLAEHPACDNVPFSGKHYPWPQRPLFLHDVEPERRSA